MCGLTGIFSPRSIPAGKLEAMVKAMTDRLAHRGPDDSGTYTCADFGLALGHRRLSILDLSPSGAQPMVSHSGRYVMVYNGEVYNHLPLKKELRKPGRVFKGRSDTEVILAAIEEWGLSKAVEKFNGMFALALWDNSRRTLSLVRDRLGIKPMYYGFAGKDFVFGSELKSLAAHPDFSRTIDRGALMLYLGLGFIPAPWTMYQGIYKLPPATILNLAWTDLHDPAPGPCEGKKYWRLDKIWRTGAADPLDISPQEAAEELERLLKDAVGLRMLADVPLGAFLSGGIGSSTVAALMQSQSLMPVKTFSIGFREKEYDETEFARQTAMVLGTEHTELYVDHERCREIIPKLPAIWDEPFADPSQLPTCLLAQLTRRHVTVSLSGDGGDELFSGYARYPLAARTWRRLRALPPKTLGLLRSGASAVSLAPILPAHLRRKLGNRSELAGVDSFPLFYRYFLAIEKHPERLVRGGDEPETIFANPPQWLDKIDPYAQMSFLDLACYLPDDILCKVDRATMAVGLEARVPMLDHRMVEFASILPTRLKRAGDKGKSPLRAVLSKYLDPKLIDRPKMGFGVPIGRWLKGPLRESALDLLDPELLKKRGLLEPGPVSRLLGEHMSGRANHEHILWSLFVLQSWLEGAAR